MSILVGLGAAICYLRFYVYSLLGISLKIIKVLENPSFNRIITDYWYENIYNSLSFLLQKNFQFSYEETITQK